MSQPKGIGPIELTGIFCGQKDQEDENSCMWYFKVIPRVDISFKKYRAFVASWDQTGFPNQSLVFDFRTSGINTGMKKTMTSMICEACKLSREAEMDRREGIVEEVGPVFGRAEPTTLTVDLLNGGF